MGQQRDENIKMSMHITTMSSQKIVSVSDVAGVK
jgi:hypothetical protein